MIYHSFYNSKGTKFINILNIENLCVETADQVTDNYSTDDNMKKRKSSDNTSYEIPPSMEQNAEKREGQAMNGVQTNHKADVTNGETNEKYYKEKLEVLKGIYEALQAKNKIDEMKLQLKRKISE